MLEDDDIVSGFVNDGRYDQPVDDLSTDFTMRREIDSHGFYRLVKACRGGKWYILKCLKEDYNLPLFERLLIKEYELLSVLSHPNIVTCTGMEEVPDLGRCIVAEFVPGRSLRVFMKEGQHMPVELYLSRAMRIAREIAEAMKHMHSRQIVHRDLKPENILITDNGYNTKIIDFSLSDSDIYAILKQPAGTPRYIAPEQYQGGGTDVRADIYSYGVVLQELFADKRLGRAAGKYRAIARKCMAAIEKRVQNADELLGLLAKAEDKKPWYQMWYFHVAVTLLWVFPVLWYSWARTSVVMLEGTSIPMAEVDSVTVGYTPEKRAAFIKALREFTVYRKEVLAPILAQEMEQRDRFVNDFTPDSILRMSREDFDIRNPRGFCMKLRNEMTLLGDMTGLPPSACYHPDIDDTEFRQHCLRMASTISFGMSRNRFGHDNVLPYGPLLQRLLYVYYPNRYVPIVNDFDMHAILEELVPDAQQRLRFMSDDKVIGPNAVLLAIHHHYPVFSEWSLAEYAYFLTHFYPQNPQDL